MQVWLDDLRNPNDHVKPKAVWVKTAKDAISIIRGRFVRKCEKAGEGKVFHFRQTEVVS